MKEEGGLGTEPDGVNEMKPEQLIGKTLVGRHLEGWRNRETGKTTKGSYLIVREIVPWSKLSSSWKPFCAKDEKFVIGTWCTDSGRVISRSYVLDTKHLVDDMHSGELKVAGGDTLDISGRKGPARFVSVKMIQTIKGLRVGGGTLAVDMSERSARSLLRQLGVLGVIASHEYGVRVLAYKNNQVLIVHRYRCMKHD